MGEYKSTSASTSASTVNGILYKISTRRDSLKNLIYDQRNKLIVNLSNYVNLFKPITNGYNNYWLIQCFNERSSDMVYELACNSNVVTV